jgi:phenylalanyl-tRNA synthetase beta chain
VEVDETVLCITDESGVIGLGGIMGGETTKAETTTRNIFLESAFFSPEAIAGRARRYNFTSDASHRFERGVDFNNNVHGIERATKLILDMCGGEPGPTEDLVVRLPERKPVRMRVARAQKIIGMAISADEMQESLERLALPVKKEGDALVVAPPSFRFDLAIEEDIVEEIARLHGFERIAAHPPRVAASFPRIAQKRGLHELRERLAAADYRELINFSFVEPQWEQDFAAQSNPIRLLNPIVSHQSVMRSTLIGSLVANVRYNQARKVERIRVFEVGRVFIRDAAAMEGPLAVRGVRQPMRIGALAYGPAVDEQWGTDTRGVDFFDVKADVEALVAPLAVRFERAEHPAFHPGRAARVRVEGTDAGWLGELHPRWQQKYELARPAVLFELDAQALEPLPLPAFAAPSRFPPVVRDMALVLDSGVPAQALLDVMAAEKPPIVSSVRLFDLYQGPGVPAGRKSLAFRVVMQDTERTLTDGEADAARDQLVALLAAKFGASLRK